MTYTECIDITTAKSILKVDFGDANGEKMFDQFVSFGECRYDNDNGFQITLTMTVGNTVILTSTTLEEVAECKAYDYEEQCYKDGYYEQ